MSLHERFADWLPAPVRLWTYRVLLTVFAVELALDASDLGLLDGRVQTAFLNVCAVLGFGLAAVNTPRSGPPAGP